MSVFKKIATSSLFSFLKSVSNMSDPVITATVKLPCQWGLRWLAAPKASTEFLLWLAYPSVCFYRASDSSRSGKLYKTLRAMLKDVVYDGSKG